MKMKLSLEQTQLLNEILDGDNPLEELDEFMALYGYDESNDPDLEYSTEVVTYEHRGSTLRRD